MSRPLVVAARVAALAALALAALAASAQEPAKQPPAKHPPAARAAAKQAAPPVQLWWNDPHLVESLSLSAEQRKKMDALFEKHPIGAPPGAPGMASKERSAYFSALRAGDVEGARKQLAVWAQAADRELREAGELRV